MKQGVSSYPYVHAIHIQILSTSFDQFQTNPMGKNNCLKEIQVTNLEKQPC